MSKLPVRRFRELCAALGLRRSGRKAELLARLLPTREQVTPERSPPEATARERRVAQLINDAASLLSKMRDEEVVAALGVGAFDTLLKAIVPPRDSVGEALSPYEFLHRYRGRASLLAFVRKAITHKYSFRGHVDGHEVFVSPMDQQWYPGATMFLQGRERFGGLIGLYRDGQISFAMSRRDAAAGEQLGPDDFEFRTIDQFKASLEEADQGQPRAGIATLRALMNRGVSDEDEYQQVLQGHPWMFGAAYTAIVGKQPLEDENIPDFMGVRSSDGCRDIIEIKPPTLPIFGRKGQFRQEFNAAWNQAERYLSFTRRQAAYLETEKGYRFRNPTVYLLMGVRARPV